MMLECNEHRREVKVDMLNRYYSQMCRSFMNMNAFYTAYKFMDGDGIFLGTMVIKEDSI